MNRLFLFRILVVFLLFFLSGSRTAIASRCHGGRRGDLDGPLPVSEDSKALPDCLSVYLTLYELSEFRYDYEYKGDH